MLSEQLKSLNHCVLDVLHSVKTSQVTSELTMHEQTSVLQQVGGDQVSLVSVHVETNPLGHLCTQPPIHVFPTSHKHTQTKHMTLKTKIDCVDAAPSTTIKIN